MNLWNGLFVKHRDFQHSSWFEHEMDNGGSYGVAEDYPLDAQLNPVDMTEYVGTRTHFVIRLTLHGGVTYDYLVPADGNGNFPSREEIKASLDKQGSTALPPGVKRELSNILTPASYELWLSVSDKPGVFNNNE